MSRNLLAIVGILICSTSAIGQELIIPQNNSFDPGKNTSFKPPSNPNLTNPNLNTGSSSAFTPVPQKPATQKPVPPQPEVQAAKATIQPVANIAPAPVAKATPKVKQEKVEPVKQQEFKPTIVAPRRTQSTIELPAPKPEVKVVELKDDEQAYQSVPRNNQFGVSDYRLEVAREKARARRMRMEVKKWYGIDSARPVVAPRVDLSTYNAYYNGVFSRQGYGYGYGNYNPYQNGNNFYFHFPVGR